MKNSVYFFLALFISSACNYDQSTIALSEDKYYNVDSLLDAQISFLTKSKAQLSKIVPSEEIVINMDSLAWSNTLAVFRHLDLNKPSLNDAYHVISNIADSSSNLTILQYQLKDQNSNQRLKELSFYYLKSLQDIKKITAESSSNSLIYSSRNLYQLYFDQEQKQTILKSYTIGLQQKTLFKDSMNSIIQFEII